MSFSSEDLALIIIEISTKFRNFVIEISRSYSMQTFYHGSSVLFSKFDLSHVLEGAAKIKFGAGLYVSSNPKSAAHYSGANKSAENHYVYTVEIPDLTEDNHIDFKKPVHSDIVSRAETKLGHSIPEKYILDVKDFRKYLAKTLGGGSDIHSEKLASEFLVSIGVDFITWPYSWKNPDLGLNICVLDDSKIKIVKIHQVELDAKQQLIAGSEREVTL